MEHKNGKTDARDTKNETRVESTDTSNDINKQVKKDQPEREIKRDMNTTTNNKMNQDIKKDIKHTNSSELDSFVKNLHYPVKKQDILDTAMREGNDEKITSALQMIHEKYYSSADELTSEISSFG